MPTIAANNRCINGQIHRRIILRKFAVGWSGLCSYDASCVVRLGIAYLGGRRLDGISFIIFSALNLTRCMLQAL